MKLLHEIKLSALDCFKYFQLSVIGFLKVLFVFGDIPDLPVNTKYNKEALRKACQIAGAINFMIAATKCSLDSDEDSLKAIEHRLKNIFAFREGYSFCLSIMDYRLLLLLESHKPYPFHLYYVLTLWDSLNNYPDWRDLPSDKRDILTLKLINNLRIQKV